MTDSKEEAYAKWLARQRETGSWLEPSLLNPDFVVNYEQTFYAGWQAALDSIYESVEKFSSVMHSAGPYTIYTDIKITGPKK